MATSRAELQKHILKRWFAKEQGFYERTDLQVLICLGPCEAKRSRVVGPVLDPSVTVDSPLTHAHTRKIQVTPEFEEEAKRCGAQWDASAQTFCVLPGSCSRTELARKGLYKSVESPIGTTTRSRSPDGEPQRQHESELKRGGGGGGGGGGFGAGSSKGRRKQDWNCPSCGKIAFAWRTRCFFCKTPDPDFKATYLRHGLFDDKDYLKTLGAKFDGDDKRW